MKCDGSVTLTVTLISTKVKLNFIVSSSMKDEILISCTDLKLLGILPRDFPAPLSNAECKEIKVGIPNHVKVVGIDSLDKIKKDYSDVLSDTLSSKPMSGTPMKIHLKQNVDIIPKRVLTARQAPLHLKEGAERVVEKLKKQDVVQQVTEPTEWIAPGMFVPKGQVQGQDVNRKRNAESDENIPDPRMVVDFSHLNKYVERPVHPFPSCVDVINNIPSDSKVFAKLDAVSGYFQIPLDEESSKLTTFLLPSGRYRFKRAPMGLNASSDEFCRRSDQAIEGLPYLLKIVDDILIFAPDQETLFQRMREVLQHCREHRITISKKKLQVGDSIKFAGFMVTKDGVKPDPEKVSGISGFPVPTDVSSLRSFIGLANQLGTFIPDLSHLCQPLNQLLKKGVAFNWLPDHQTAFDKIKEVLTSDLLVKYFDPSLRTELLTDASRPKSLGFALIQKDDQDRIRLIQCGSRSLIPAESRYATVELECLAIQWAVKKCRHFLMGLPIFKVVTDHRPLVGVFAKPLFEVENARIQKYREKLSDYNFSVEWVAGKTHLIADGLSRAPVFSPSEEEVQQVHVFRIISEDPKLSVLVDEAAKDKEYQSIIDAVLGNLTQKELPKESSFRSSQGKEFWRLSIYLIRVSLRQELQQGNCTIGLP